MADDHKDALEAYKVCSEAAQDNERTYEEDYEFWRLDKQWEDKWVASRSEPGKERPMFTFNRGPAFARQVVNDIRKNRPAIKTHPADSAADIETALVMQGLIRNINYASRGDIARDTAAECAVYGGFGYYRIDIEYACDDTFDEDIRINRIVNPLSVKGDPYSTGADSLDWNMAFIIDVMTPDAFKDAYPKADPVSFDMMDDKVKRDWTDGSDIIVAEYWKRAKAMKAVLLLSDGKVVDAKQFDIPDPDTGLSQRDICEAQRVAVKGERQIETYVVDQCILNGQEELTDKIRWVGKYIPIIPIYGEEIHLKGKRYFWSMLHRGRDAQTQFNYHETTATELYALSPRVPWLIEEGSEAVDPNWSVANTQNLPYLLYKRGGQIPQRQPLDAGPMVGAMALSKGASDNLKATLGMYDASLGQRSNESSGIAIERRDQQSDVGNFHLIDNVSRGIACEGVQLLDLIPKVYTKGRIARVMGDDGAHQNIQLGDRQRPEQPPQPGQEPNPPKIGALEGVFDLSMGKYDVTVEAGPSYTTQRQETAAVLGELMRSDPRMMEIGGDIVVGNLDIKDGDELARRMKKMLPPQLQDNAEQAVPPQVQQQMAQMQEALQVLTEENQKLKQDEVGKVATVEKAKSDHEKNEVEMAKTMLARDRLPVENAQAQAQLVNAQKDLEVTRATLGQTSAETATTQATGNAADAITQAAMVLAQAAQTLAASAASNAVTNAAPKRKQMRIAKVNGEWHGESVETPEPQIQ